MEGQDPAGPDAKGKSEASRKDPRVVQAETVRGILTLTAPHQIKKEPGEGLNQCWETQWQEFLKTVESPQLGWENPQVPQGLWSKSDVQEFQAYLKGIGNGSKWSRGECMTQPQPGHTGENQVAFKCLDPSVEVKEEAADEDAVRLEMWRQRFRQFCYQDTKGPQKVLSQLQELCRLWLRPERRSKEQILEMVVLEQFLSILPQEMQRWVKEHVPVTCVKAVSLAEDFLLGLREVGRTERKKLRTLEEMPANSNKSKQDTSDTTELPLPMEFKLEGDREASLLATKYSGWVRRGSSQQRTSWSIQKALHPSRDSRCHSTSDSQVLDLLMEFSSPDLEHSASSTDSSGEEAQEEPLGHSKETVLVGDDEDEEEEVVEVIVPGTPPWTTSHPQLLADYATADDMPFSSTGRPFLGSFTRSTTGTMDTKTTDSPTSGVPCATPTMAKRLSDTVAIGVPNPAKRGRKVSSYVWGHFTHTTDKFTVVCNHCRQHLRLGKEGGCARVGTTSMHRHMSVHHPLLLPKKAPSKSSADFSSPFTISAMSPEASVALPPTPSPTSGASSQSTLHETVAKEQIWAPSDPLAMEHNQWLAEFLAKSMQPCSLVGEPAFREFLHRCVPQWRVPGKNYFSASAIPALAVSIKDALKKELKECIGGTVHLTADIWTSCQVQDYMSVTGHWMVHDPAGCLVRHKAVLDMSGFGHIHTAGTVGQKLQSVLEDWLTPLGIKPCNTASDNAADLVKALRDRGLKHIPCTAHCLNLVVKGGLAKCSEELSTTLETARAICNHFRHSATAQAHLRDIQQHCNVPKRRLVQDVATRWNTTLHMLERLHEQRQAITEYFEGCSELHLSPGQWELIKDVISVLGPFQEATQMLSQESATLGQVLPMLRLVEVLLQDISHTARDGTPSYTVSTDLLFYFQTNRHLKAVRANVTYLTASFLDPRFRDTFHTYVGGTEGQLQRKMEEVEDHVLGEIAEVCAKKFGSSKEDTEEELHSLSMTQPGPSGSLPPATSTHSFKDWWLQHANRVGITRPAVQQRAQRRRSKAAAAAKQELDAYRRDEVGEFCEPGSDPAKYWERKRHVWPSLYIVAVRYLACPPTSVFSERLFLAAGNIGSEGRSRLTIQDVNVLCFIRMNGEWLPKDPVSGPAGIFEKLCKDVERDCEQELEEAEFSDDEDARPLLQKTVFDEEHCI